jgi:hypothetical protein
MKKQLFAALAFAGAFAAWSMTAHGDSTAKADFVVKNESHRTIVGLYIVPHGQKFLGNQNWMQSPLLGGQSAELHFFEVAPGPRYDVAVVYADHSSSTWPFMDLAMLNELRAYVGDDGTPALSLNEKDSGDHSWF